MFDVKEKKFYGMYRAKIEKVLKNSLYKVRIFPYLENAKVDDLPIAQSNLSNRLFYINLKEGDLVWVFFEGGNPIRPIIFDICSVVNKNIEAEVGKYPDFYKIKINDNITFEVDDKNNVVNIKINNFNLKIDKDNKMSIKNTTSNMYSILKDVIDILQKVITVGNLQSPAGVVLYSYQDDVLKLVNDKTKLDNIMKE